MDTEMYVTEYFGPTLQGEGILAGTMASFIRTAGCTVGCAHCDTKKSWAFGSHVKKPHPLVGVSTLVEAVQHWKTDYVVITGGEPMETESRTSFAELCRRLDEDGRHITIELSGSVDPEDNLWMSELVRYVDLWSFSPKVESMAPVKPPIPKFIASILRAAESAARHRCEYGQLKLVMDPDKWGTSVAEVEGLLQELADQDCPCVPVLLQTLTLPRDGPTEILNRQKRLFEKASAYEGNWGKWSPREARITVQNHVLVGMR